MEAPQAPGEAPHRVAGNIGKRGINGLKNLPPWAMFAVAGAVLLLVIYLRRSKSTPTSTQDASAASTDSTDPSASYGSDGYGNVADNAGGVSTALGAPAGSSYGTGYQQGLSDGESYGFGLNGMNNTATTAGSGTSPETQPAAAPTDLTLNFLSLPVGGGAPNTGGAAVHAPPKPAQHVQRPHVTGPPKAQPHSRPKVTTAKNRPRANPPKTRPKPPARRHVGP